MTKNTVTKKEVLAFLKAPRIGVLSTVNKDGTPHAAALYVVSDSDFNLTFVTPERTAKFANIVEQPQVVYTLTDEESKETLSVYGEARKQPDDQLPQALEQLAAKLAVGERHVESLPLLRFKGQKKVVVTIKATSILFRRFTNGGLEEYREGV